MSQKSVLGDWIWRSATTSTSWDWNNNVVVYLDTMASISLRVRVYMVDNGHYNVEVHRKMSDMVSVSVGL